MLPTGSKIVYKGEEGVVVLATSEHAAVRFPSGTSHLTKEDLPDIQILEDDDSEEW